MTSMRRAETLLREALTLPDDERAEIAGALLESLEPAPEVDVEAAWRQEVAARVAALEESPRESSLSSTGESWMGSSDWGASTTT